MGSCGLTVGGVRHTTLSMTPTYILLGCFLSFLHLGHTSSSSDLCKDTGCLTHFTNQGVEAQCVNVLHANWTEIGEEYDLSTSFEDGLCDGACCRCFKLRAPTTTIIATTTTTTTSPTTTTTQIVIRGSLMAIGGLNIETYLSSSEVVNTSCDFPLPEYRY